jgi:hypothetical protein
MGLQFYSPSWTCKTNLEIVPAALATPLLTVASVQLFREGKTEDTQKDKMRHEHDEMQQAPLCLPATLAAASHARLPGVKSSTGQSNPHRFQKSRT